MSAAINERQQIHDRVEKYLDTAKDLPTLPRIKGMPKGFDPTGRMTPPETKRWMEKMHRDFIYYNSSPALKVVGWIRYHPMAVAEITAIAIGALYITYGR